MKGNQYFKELVLGLTEPTGRSRLNGFYYLAMLSARLFSQYR
jgi:hypothetical protein